MVPATPSTPGRVLSIGSAVESDIA